MVSGKLVHRGVCGVLLSMALASCSMFDTANKTQETPNHSWFKGENYGTEGANDAELATVAYSQGKFEDAENHVIQALRLNPRQPQALMVGALVYEQMGRLNRARQYYEDLIIVGGEETSILGTDSGKPESMAEIARRRLRRLNMMQSEFMIEDKDGAMVFNISQEASARQGKSAMDEALFVRQQKMIAENKADTAADMKAVEVLFSDEEKNIISRFLILNELAENDMITQQEFLAGRAANIGGLLPLTNKAPAFGIDKPVPSSDLIIERINSLRSAVEARAITPQEFSAERDLIVEAILPPKPKLRMQNKAPSKDILSAAKDLRKLEVISQLNLITDKEKAAEKAAIEKNLGLIRAADVNKKATTSTTTAQAAKSAPKANNQAAKPAAKSKAPTTSNTQPVEVEEENVDVQVLVPEVTSPF